MLDFWLNEPVDAAILRERFQNALPAEIRLLDLYPIDNSLPSLQASLLSSDYLISLPEELNQNDFTEGFQNLLAQDSILLTRKEKTVDVKPLILDYAFTKDSSPNLNLKIRLSSTPSGNLRPDDLLNLLEVDPADCTIERIALNFETAEVKEKENG
jgi:radical SAM-linked protein